MKQQQFVSKLRVFTVIFAVDYHSVMTINMADVKGHDSAGEDLDIVVVGAGLTGLFLTHLLLEVYKIDPSKIVLLERQPKRYDLPRAAGFSDDNARLYRTCMPKEAVDSAVQKITRPVSICSSEMHVPGR